MADVKNPYREGIHTAWHGSWSGRHDLHNIMNDLPALLAQAWKGGTSSQARDAVQHLHGVAYRASGAAYTEFETAYNAEPKMVDEFAWQTRWRTDYEVGGV